MEKQQISELDYKKTIEQSANFDGNWSLVLFDRMHDPIIRQQLINFFYTEQLARQKYFQTGPFEFVLTMDDGNKVYKDGNGRQVLEGEIKSFVPKTKEEIEKELDERLAKVMSYTDIEFSNEQPTEESIGLFWVYPYTGKQLTMRQKSIAEAHEKGHILRPLPHLFSEKYFAPAFDMSKVVFTEDDLKAMILERQSQERNSENVMPDPTREREIYLEYLFSGKEIVERMSQLKNYFGMRGAEHFTREHLEYARQHYLNDIGIDNGMAHFFQAITSKTENNFLELINSSGI